MPVVAAPERATKLDIPVFLVRARPFNITLFRPVTCEKTLLAVWDILPAALWIVFRPVWIFFAASSGFLQLPPNVSPRPI